MLEALASLEQLEERMGTIENEAAARAALVDASALVRAEAPSAAWVAEDSDVEAPDVVVVVVLQAAARALRNPDGAQSEGIGTYNVAFGATLGGVWLTKNERRVVRYAAGVGSGIGSIELESPWQPEVSTVPVDIGGDELPWVTLGEGGVA